MEINTFGAFATAAISSLFGFGLAFFWFAKIKSKTSTKSQRVLLSIASISIGYGLTFIINEFIGFPLQGLSIRYDKIIGYLIVNVLLLPTIFGTLIWLLQPKQFHTEELKESNKLESPDNINLQYALMKDAYSQSPVTDTKNNKINPMAYAYKNEDASLSVESLKRKYKVDDYDLAQASNEIKNKKVNENIWNYSASQNNRIDNAKRQYIIMRSQEIAYEKYQNNVKEVITKAHIQDTEKTTIAHNHAPDVKEKTIYEMFNEKSSLYESTEKYNNYENKKSNKLIWCIFIVIIIAVLYFIRNHKIVLFQ